jgi:hypothetical protein
MFVLIKFVYLVGEQTVYADCLAFFFVLPSHVLEGMLQRKESQFSFDRGYARRTYNCITPLHCIK